MYNIRRYKDSLGVGLVEKIEDLRMLQSNITKTQEITGTPKRVVYKVEREFIMKVMLEGIWFYYGFVVVDVDIDSGKTYFEVFEISDDQAKFWKKAQGAQETNEQLTEELFETFQSLVNIMSVRRKTNIVVETCTPNKKVDVVKKKQVPLSEYRYRK